MKLLSRTILSMMTAALLTASAAQAQPKPTMGEAYAEPTLREMAQALVMLNGLDMTSTSVVDDYAKLFYCALYREKFKNDFEWHKVRQMVSGRIKMKKDYYRVLYEVVGQVKLGRYNFETQDFPFIFNTALLNVGRLSLVDEVKKAQKMKTVAAAGTLEDKNKPEPCYDTKTKTAFYIPFAYDLQLSQPITFDRLKLPTAEAENLLARMRAARNTSRVLYVRFRLKILAPVKEEKKKDGAAAGFHGYLTSMDVFLDRNLSQLVASIPVGSDNVMDPSGFSPEDMPEPPEDKEKKLDELNNLKQ
jgi:hypothetical protein